ncbi:MAG: DegT/DnrJ/EryC1/StrS family aminotransferase [Pseudomonadota bacterium]
MNGVVNLSLAARSTIGDIAFIDLKAQQRRLRDGIERRMAAVLDHGRYIAGPEIDALEETLAQRIGGGPDVGVVACASGTTALVIPLMAWELGADDAVFLPSFTYNATANAVLLAGATPVFVDIDPDTFNLCPKDLAARVEAVKDEGRLRPRAIIAVDLFGAPADYAALTAIAEADGMHLLADGAQSFGGRLNGRQVGDLAPATSLSFFPGKALGAYGEGGAVVGRDADLVEAWRSIRWHGTDEGRKNSVRVGFNGRMDSMQAAVLLEKLAIFDDELEARHRIAADYDARLAGFAGLQRLVGGAQSGRNYYSVRVANRDRVAAALRERGVPTAIYYATPLHRMPAFEAYAPRAGLPATDALAADILALPMHPYLTPDQVAYIADNVEAAARLSAA